MTHAGVGPEIIVKACRRLLPRLAAGELRMLVIGHRSALHAARDLLHEPLAFPESDDAPLALLLAGEERRADPLRRAVPGSRALRLPGGGARRDAGEGRAD